MPEVVGRRNIGVSLFSNKQTCGFCFLPIFTKFKTFYKDPSRLKCYFCRSVKSEKIHKFNILMKRLKRKSIIILSAILLSGFAFMGLNNVDNKNFEIAKN